MEWPLVTREMRPWTRWWWLGSAVDGPNLTHLLETYHKAGLGGVEITPIYEVKGQEARDLPYLSPGWLEALRHTLSEAHRLDMGVDMPTGTGWPFGGPQVTEADTLDRLNSRIVHVAGGHVAALPAGIVHPQALVAVSGRGQSVPLMDHLTPDGRLEWTAPTGDDWTLYAVEAKWSGMKVKRAAPGSEGRCINPFSHDSLAHYLARFDTALADLPKGALRCHFHDSFEYAANWTPTLFDEFRARRGYDLRDHLPEFLANGSNGEGAGGKGEEADLAARVKTDYHETIADLLLQNFTQSWTAWAHKQGSLSRNQAHGSPGNLLDLYGAADIPETEVFRSKGDVRVSKFASSAAHVMGKPLVSSESCTWQSEHFTETLADSKHILDRLLVAGINHIFYHGTAYSPQDAAWPGWLFYASTHFEPNNPTWRDFPTLNSYVTRCQSLLQAGQSDNDVLLYWPLHDLWQKHPKLFGLTIEGKWLESEPFGDTAQVLWDRGYTFDYISDRQLHGAKAISRGVKGDEIGLQLPGGTYRTVLVPPCKFMPLDTLQALLSLAHEGATVLFQNSLPQDVPGLGDLAKRRQRFQSLIQGAHFAEAKEGVRVAEYGKGHLLMGEDVNALLARAHVVRESMVDHTGVMFVRRKVAEGHHYLVVNQSDKPLDGWVTLGTDAHEVALLNPMTGRVGMGAVRQGAGSEVYLQLQPGESVLLRTHSGNSKSSITGSSSQWHYLHGAGDPVALTGSWRVEAIAGGPELPPVFTLLSTISGDRLASWTVQENADWQRFGGTARYTLTFDAPKSPANAHPAEWLLELGEVHESVHVRLNGNDYGTLIAPPFQVRLDALKPTGNLLELEVTNLAANRIRDMDRRKVEWRIFREINFVNIDYKPFDASHWELHASGLIGPVRLLPMSRHNVMN